MSLLYYLSLIFSFKSLLFTRPYSLIVVSTIWSIYEHRVALFQAEKRVRSPGRVFFYHLFVVGFSFLLFRKTNMICYLGQLLFKKICNHAHHDHPVRYNIVDGLVFFVITSEFFIRYFLIEREVNKETDRCLRQDLKHIHYHSSKSNLISIVVLSLLAYYSQRKTMEFSLLAVSLILALGVVIVKAFQSYNGLWHVNLFNNDELKGVLSPITYGVSTLMLYLKTFSYVILHLSNVLYYKQNQVQLFMKLLSYTQYEEVFQLLGCFYGYVTSPVSDVNNVSLTELVWDFSLFMGVHILEHLGKVVCATNIAIYARYMLIDLVHQLVGLNKIS